jgi:hypothetical protein
MNYERQTMAEVVTKDLVWIWNVGKGNPTQRTIALIYTALDHPTQLHVMFVERFWLNN